VTEPPVLPIQRHILTCEHVGGERPVNCITDRATFQGESARLRTCHDCDVVLYQEGGRIRLSDGRIVSVNQTPHMVSHIQPEEG
jgi:hypothetical protein